MNNNNSVNFRSATHVYFFTSDGKRIISDKNMRTCERYLVRQLNGAKNLKLKNHELVDTFKYDKRQFVGDRDYSFIPKVRSVYNKAKGYVNIITGKDVRVIDEWGKRIGQAKALSKERTGTTKSFETSDAVKRYNRNAIKFANEHGIYKDGKRQAFGVIFDPKYNRKGELKGFEYNRSGYFDEEFIK